MNERRTRRAGRSRLRPLAPLALLWAIGLLVLGGVVLQRQVSYRELLLDPNNLAGVPWYTGIVSNLGILGWTTATATGFFGAWISHYCGRRAAAGMLVEGACLSAVLLFDDLFQLHVVVRPLIGLPKATAYLAYLLLAGHWAITSRSELQRTRFELLVAAGGAFAISIGFDQVAGGLSWIGADHGLLVEDAAKFLGVLAWAQFFVLTSGDIVASVVGELRSAARAAPVGADRPEERSVPTAATPLPDS